MTRPIPHFLALLVVLSLVAAGCGGKKSSQQSTIPAYVPPSTAAVLRATFERSYSECSTTSVLQLAAKYTTAKNRKAVSLGVGKGWAKVFKGGPDAARNGAKACLQGFRSKG